MMEKIKSLVLKLLIRNLSPILENILLVDGLKANLISISELCDKGMNAILRPSKCIIIDCEENILFEALRNEIFMPLILLI